MTDRIQAEFEKWVKDHPPTDGVPDLTIHMGRYNRAVIRHMWAAWQKQSERVSDLIAQLDRSHKRSTESEKQLKDSRANDYTAMCYLADCRMAVGDNGKRMLPEFVEYLRQLRQQRDELLAALKDARELVDDWGAYATAYMQEKHDLAGDIERLDAAISKVEEQS